MIEDFIDDLFIPIGYRFTTYESRRIITMLIERIDSTTPFHHPYYSLVDYIFELLVIKYGDYGINPKCGWIWEENKKPIKDALLSWLEAEEEHEQGDDIK